MNRTQQAHPHVLIVGGGIAGPALALFLRKAGISCALYEAHPFVTGIGGGLSLAPNGTKVLAALGVADRLGSQAARISTYAFRNARGSLLARAQIDPAVVKQPMLAVSRAAIFEALADEMQAREVEAHYGKRLTHIDEQADRVVVQFDDGSAAEGDLLIGADGIRSIVRRHVLPDADAAYTGMVGIGGFSPLTVLSADARETMTFVSGRRGFFGYSAAGTGRALWWSNLFRDREFTRAELERTDLAAVKADLLERFGDYAAPVPALIAQTDGVLRLNVHDVPPLPRWHRGRVMLIGDAAHAVSPSAGQGASLALEDAMYLAKLLRDHDYATAFAQFERDRKPRAEKVMAEGRRRGQDKAIVSPLQQRIRELMIRLFVPLFARHGDRWLYDYQIAW